MAYIVNRNISYLLCCVISILAILFITSSAARTAAQAQFTPAPPVDDGTLRRIQVPILMYHYVSPLLADADAIRRDLTVEPQIFRAHMRYLRDRGYTPISLYDLDEALNWGAPLPANPVILTFDDGYIDHYTYVLPILQEFNFLGTFFVITGFADAQNPDYLNWSHIREMAQAGMSMESHTKSHADLRDREHDFLVYQMLGSLESLAAHTARPSRMFSYPGGFYDADSLEVARQLGVWRAVTTQPGMTHTTNNRLELTRVRVSGATGVSGLEYLLGGEWLTDS